MRLRLRPVLALTIASGLLSLLSAKPAQAAIDIDIDTFATAQDPTTNAFVSGAGIWGVERDMRVTKVSGAGTVTAPVTAGLGLVLTSGAGTQGDVEVAWDGADGDAAHLRTSSGTAPTPADLLTAHDGFKIAINSTNVAGAILVMEVFTDSSHSSVRAVQLPLIASPQNIFLRYAGFAANRGAQGANFASVRAIRMFVRGTGVTVRITRVSASSAATSVSAQKTVNPTSAKVGDTLNYDVTIQSTQGDALATAFTDTVGANTTFVPGSVRVGPIAINDTYNQLTSPITIAATGVLTNDREPDGVNGPLTSSNWSATTGRGGTVTATGTDGAFTYTSTLTEAIPDTFTYQLNDAVTGTDGLVDTAVVVVTVTAQAPKITSANTTTFNPGVAGTFTVTTDGFPNGASMVLTNPSGTPPTGVTFTDNTNGTATLAGTPQAFTQNSSPYSLTFNAANGIAPPDSQIFTLNVVCLTIDVAGNDVPNQVFNTAMTNITYTQPNGNAHGGITWSVSGLPAGLSINSSGVLSGTPTQTGTYGSGKITATDAFGCAGSKNLASFTVAPVAVTDSYNGGMTDNTQAVVTGGSTANPGTPFVALSGRLIANDLPSGAGNVTITPGTFSTNAGGSVTIAADGTFIYTPKANPTAAATTSDFFSYTISSNTGGTPAAVTATGIASLTLVGRVWYVKNNGSGTNGQSQSPFTTLSAAIAASTATSDTIFVYRGDGATTGLATASILKASQKLIGEGVALVVNSNTLVAAGSFPLIGNTVTLASGVTVNGLDMSTTTSDGIVGNAVTGISVTVHNLTTTTGKAINLTGAGNTGTLSFTSVSAGTVASGPTNGILISSLGGTLTVSGGTIQKTTGAAVSLSNTGSVSLSSMTIKNSAAEAILGTSINGFTLAGSAVTGNAGTGTAAIYLTDTTGAVSFASDTVTGTTGVNGFNVQLHASNTSTAAITTLNVTGGSYSSSAQNGGFLIDLRNNATIGAAWFNAVTFSGNFSKGLQLQTNNNSTIGDSTTAPLGSWSPTPPNGSVTVSGCTFTNNNVAASFESGGGTGGTGSVYYRFVNNTTITGSHSVAVNFANGSDSGGGTYKAFISGNHIGTAGVANSGSAIGEGLRVFMQGQQVATVTIDSNLIRGLSNGAPTAFSARGIDIEELGRPNAGFGQTRLDVKVTNNNVDGEDTTGFPQYSIYVAADAQGTGTSGSDVRAEIHTNTVPATAACDSQCDPDTGAIVYETVNGATGTMAGKLFTFGAGATVSAQIANNNTGTTGKTCSYLNGGTLTLTGTAPNTVN